MNGQAAAKTCENCGKTIGNLEEWRDWRGKDVCRLCEAQLFATAKSPTTEDRFKCGNEINQLHNQQFTLATAAITFFGVYVGWFVPKLLEGNKSEPTSPLSATLYFVSTITLLAIFWMLFYWSGQIGEAIVTIAVYLEITKSSVWERRIQEFSKVRNIGLWREVSGVFLLLGFAAFLPFVFIIYFLQMSLGNEWIKWIGIFLGSTCHVIYLA